jgi:hypothetical protein
VADPPRLSQLFNRTPEEAVAFIRQKGYAIGFDYRDVWQKEHQASFTVAKAMRLDILADIRAGIDKAIVEGTTLKQFQDELRPLLVKKGWWGKAEMVDPETGEITIVQLGSPRRLKVIYETNLRTAHMEGKWERIQGAKASRPYLQYLHTPSPNERPEHAAWDRLILPVDDSWWQVHYPVKAYGCKCDVRPLSDDDLTREGLAPGTAPEERYYTWTNKRTGETLQVPVGVDPSFDYPPGGRLPALGKMFADKVEAAAAGLGAAVFQTVATTVMPVLMQDYTRWVAAIEGGGQKGLGGRRVIGAVTATTLAWMKNEKGIDLVSSGLSVEQREITHLFAYARKGSKAVPSAWVYGLPEKLLAPDAVIYDSTPGNAALLYVWKEGAKYVRLVVKPNFLVKKESYTNAIRSAQYVERANLTGKYFELIEGSL